jgi:hypothetical protein
MPVAKKANLKEATKMLTPIITGDKVKLTRQITALQEELKRSELPEKDRQIFEETLKAYREALGN